MSSRLRLLLILPALVCILPFVSTLAVILRFSLSADAQSIDGYSLENYVELAEPFYLKSLWITVKLAAASTLIVLVLAVPVAMVLASLTRNWARRALSTAVLLPLFLNLLIQAYGWMIVLGPAGLVNRALIDSGLIARPLVLLFSEVGVLAGLVQTSLPLAVFPILSGARVISRDLLEASASLGEGSWMTFRRVVLPLLGPGIVAAGSIVLAYNASAFAVPLLLGGRRVQMLGIVIKDRIAPLLDFAGAAATGVLLIMVTLAVMGLAGHCAARIARVAAQGRAA